MTTLFDFTPMEEIYVEPQATLRDRFEAFDRMNPAIYLELRRLAFQLLNAGHRKFGVKLLIEQVRWSLMITTSDPSGFKIDNRYTAFYARSLMRREPSLAGVFSLRASEADDD